MKYLILMISALFVIGCSYKSEAVPDTSLAKCEISVTKAKLATIFSSANSEDLDHFYSAMEYSCYFGFKDKQDEDMYLATVLTEVGSDAIGVRENLNYSCDALPSLFSYYREHGGHYADGRCDNHSAKQYDIGSKIYANRLGNGSVASGDGYTYRGGGYAQTTGYTNYNSIVVSVNDRAGSNYTTSDFANNITNPYIASLGGMGYWMQVDASSCADMDCVTRKWNYYTDTYDEREHNYNWIKSL